MAAAKRKTIPKAVRQQVYDSLNGHCGYCGCKITYKEMQVDHIEAVYLHEEELNAGQAQEINSIENYMPACRMCNFYKSTMSVENVCSPYRGDTKRNKEYARKLTRAAINNGFVRSRCIYT